MHSNILKYCWIFQHIFWGLFGDYYPHSYLQTLHLPAGGSDALDTDIEAPEPNRRRRRRADRLWAAMKMTEENTSGNSEMTMDDVKNLIKKKDNIEEQIKAYYDVLEDVSQQPHNQTRRSHQLTRG